MCPTWDITIVIISLNRSAPVSIHSSHPYILVRGLSQPLKLAGGRAGFDGFDIVMTHNVRYLIQYLA